VIVLFVNLYFTTLDLNIDGFEREEGLKDFEEDQGQIVNQGKPSFDLLLFILLVVFIVPLYTWFLVSCVMFGPLLYAYLLPSMLKPLLMLCILAPKYVEPLC
jgi:hypothetical protein